MKIQEFIEKGNFKLVNKGQDLERELTQVYCCDLLSLAMSRAPEQGVWVTVMGNMNTLAVASLTEVGCLVLAEGMGLDEMATKKAVEEGITVFQSEKPVFEAAQEIYYLLEEKKE